MYKYYLTQRPPSLGTQPKGTVDIRDYGKKIYIIELGREAWGYAIYKDKLSDKEIEEFELVEAINN